jgi:hypothetical protein|tara:strand:- start:636 stop:896 length:261 start_codon:yes stop_codon:yes gene_type:complete
MKNPKQKYGIPEYDPQTGDRNPFWGELSESDKIEGLPPLTGGVDMNQIKLDKLVEMLDDKYKFSSTGDAYAIHRLIEFYKKNKENE